MLGRLLTATSSLNPVNYGKGPTTLESATEEQHTRSLLFPDLTSLPSAKDLEGHATGQSPPAHFRYGPFDDRGGLELDEVKDMRIIIAQDAIADQDKPCVLLDTKSQGLLPQSRPTSHEQDIGPSVRHTRVTSSTSASRAQVSPMPASPAGRTPFSAFSPNPNARNRSSTISGMSEALSASQTRDLEAKDHTNGLLDCIFGVSGSVKAGSSTKMHVVSSEKVLPGSSTAKAVPLSPLAGHGHSGARPQAPSRAQTFGNVALSQSPHPTDGSQGSAVNDVILITRMFNVGLPEPRDDRNPKNADQHDQITATRAAGLPATRQKPPKLRETKTPAYAVSIVFQLPRATESRPPSRQFKLASGSSSIRSPASSSYGSDIQSSWTLLDALPLSLTSPHSLKDNIDHRVEAVVEHWDVIVRALSALQHEATIKILELLKQFIEAPTAPVVKNPKEKTMQRTNQRPVHLPAWSLDGVPKLRIISVSSLKRIAHALRIPRVVPGMGLKQGGHWLEEARTVARLCGGRQQDFFLYNLLTAFLGNHTEWLSCLGPALNKKRRVGERSDDRSTETLATRTIIICDQRSPARRLIFLLASFLPGPGGLAAFQSTHDITTAGFTPHLLQSPSSGQMSRKHSLRRTANRKARESFLTGEISGRQALSLRAPLMDIEEPGSCKTETGTAPGLVRKISETPGILTSATLPIPTSESGLRKSSAFTTSTVTPTVATPLAHFASGSQGKDSYFPTVMPTDNADGVASADLARLLRRNSSSLAATSSGPSSGSTKWGSLLSGFWSVKQASSDKSQLTTPSVYSPTRQRIVGSGVTQPCRTPQPVGTGIDSQIVDISSASADLSDLVNDSSQPNLEPTKSISIPPRLNVDEHDGVVDVDLRLPGFLSSSMSQATTSLEASLARHSPSGNSVDGASSVLSSKSHADALHKKSPRDQINVAGFLKHYHQDFALQAVRPYSELTQEIKQSMSAEQTPRLAHGSAAKDSEASDQDRWVNVCTTLVADAQAFTVSRLTLKRKISHIDSAARPNSCESRLQSERTQAGRNRTNDRPEEMFSTEKVMDFDTTLTDAIERALNERVACASRAISPSRFAHSRTVSASTASPKTPPSVPSSLRNQDMLSNLEQVRKDPRRAVVSALEEVVKSVNDDLHSHGTGRDIPRPDNASTGSATKKVEKEENALREGVKRWLLSVEQTEVW